MGANQVATSITALTTGERGFANISLDSIGGTAVPIVLAGSVVEVASALFAWSEDETPNASSWTAIATGSTVYMQCTPSGSAGNQILTTSYTTDGPTFVETKGAWYTSAGSNVRVIASLTKGSETLYQDKRVDGGLSHVIFGSAFTGPKYQVGFLYDNPMTQDQVFTALSPWIPSTGQTVVVSGSLTDAATQHLVLARANRASGTAIALYGLRTGSTGAAIGSVTVNSGNSGTVLNVVMSW